MFVSLMLMVASTQVIDNVQLVQRSSNASPIALTRPSGDYQTQVRPVEPMASNFETWRSAIHTTEVMTILPTKVRFRHQELWWNRNRILPATLDHHPWHAVLRYSCYWFDQPTSCIELSCILHQEPSFDQPEYVASATCVPSITCHAKTLEELEQLLLAEYVKYLRTSVRKRVPYQRWHCAEHDSPWLATLPAVNWMYDSTWDLFEKPLIANAPWMQFTY